uniref:Myb/SANT-like domain-containing protein n=1 Tax=Lactuca sativa TaxID=4236 RepID=A0A9R1WRU7_LACSA|nr:hypothetical protein LSAT_V11C900471110 [Lactuca sativa]
MNELKNGNRHKTTCQNICKRLLEQTDRDLDRNQIKNKWDIMRKEFKYYDRLTRLETEISIDHVRNIISALKEWWDEKTKNLEVYETYYEALFRDNVAVRGKAKLPCEFGDNSTLDDVQFVDITDGKEASDEVLLFDDVDPFLTYSSSSMKGKSMVSSSYEQNLDTVFDVLLTRSTQTSRQTTHSPTTEECMTIVSTFPGFEEGSIGYLEALEVFLKKSARQNFMVPKTDETKMEFLKKFIWKAK